MSFAMRSIKLGIPAVLLLAGTTNALADQATMDCGGTLYRIDYDTGSVERGSADGSFEEPLSAVVTATQVRFREARLDVGVDVVIDRTSGSIDYSSKGGSPRRASCREVEPGE